MNEIIPRNRTTLKEAAMQYKNRILLGHKNVPNILPSATCFSEVMLFISQYLLKYKLSNE